METVSAIFICFLIIIFCFILYDSIPSEYTKLEESFGGFMYRSLFRFEYEKSPLHIIVYGGTGTGKTYFFRQYLKLYLDPSQDEEQAKNIALACKDDTHWIDPETGEFYIGFNKYDMSMITTKNLSNFKDSVIVLDDMGDKLNKDIGFYFTEGRHHKIQMIVMCHKTAQINNTARMSCDTIYLTIYNGKDLFDNFNSIYKCDYKFYDIISELNSSYYNCIDGIAPELRYGIIKYNKKDNTFIIIDRNRTMIYDSRVGFFDLKALSLKDELDRENKNKLIAYMKPLMNNATDRNTIDHDSYQFYFNKLLKLKDLKIQNDVLTKENFKANGFRIELAILGIIAPAFMIYNLTNPNATAKTAAFVATAASGILNKTNILVNYGSVKPFYGYGEGGQFLKKIRDEYTNDEGILNRRGREYLCELYKDKEEFRNEIVDFVKDKSELEIEVIIDNRCKTTNILKSEEKKCFTRCILSKDYTEEIIGIMAKYVDEEKMDPRRG